MRNLVLQTEMSFHRYFYPYLCLPSRKKLLRALQAELDALLEESDHVAPSQSESHLHTETAQDMRDGSSLS